MKIDVAVFLVDRSLLAFSIFLACMARLISSGIAAISVFAGVANYTYIDIKRSSLSLAHSFRSSFDCILKTS